MLASTVIAEWDRNGQQNHRRKTLEPIEMRPEDQWLEKCNQLKEFYQNHGHARVTCTNCEDKSLVRWVDRQRRCCETEIKIKLLNDVGFDWTSQEDRWLEKCNQFKEFCKRHGHARVTYSNCSDKSLVDWVCTQRHDCKIESRTKL